MVFDGLVVRIDGKNYVDGQIDARLKREAEERKIREAEEKAKREAEVKARKEAERKRREEEEKARREAQLHQIISFRSAQIPQFEADILQEIETLTKLKFTKVEKIEWNTKMGFTAENNTVTGIGLYEYKLSITNLKSLQTLNLGYNKFSTLPESIGNLSSLQSLDLGGNMFTTLPESIKKLESLTYLGLSSNKFSTLPESVTNMNSLKNLYISGNSLDSRAKSILEQLKKNGVSVST